MKHQVQMIKLKQEIEIVALKSESSVIDHYSIDSIEISDSDSKNEDISEIFEIEKDPQVTP